MNTLMTKLGLAAVVAVSMSAPVFAADWSQSGDFYAPTHTIVQQATAAELNQARQGDFYAPGKTVVTQPTAADLNQARDGDFYAPAN